MVRSAGAVGVMSNQGASAAEHVESRRQAVDQPVDGLDRQLVGGQLDDEGHDEVVVGRGHDLSAVRSSR